MLNSKILRLACAAILSALVLSNPAVANPFSSKNKKDTEPVKGDLEALQDTKQIAVPFFRIKFLKETLAASQAKSGFLSRGASASAKVNLAGVSDDAFQKITEQTYSDLLAKLRERNIEVLDKDTILSAKSYMKIKDKYPDIDDDESVHVPEGFKFPGGITIGLTYGKVLGDIKSAILSVDYVVNFVSFDSKTFVDVGVGGQSAEAEISAFPVLHVTGTASAIGYNAGEKCEKVSAACAGGNSNASIGVPTYSTTNIGSISDVTSDGMKAAQAVTGLLSAVTGGSKSKRANMEVSAEEAAYINAAVEALSKANDRFVGLISGE